MNKTIILFFGLLIIPVGGYYYLNNYTTLLSSSTLTQLSNTSTLNSEVCKVSLTYPKEWTGKLTEGLIGCTFNVENSSDESNYFILNPITNTTWEEIVSQNPQNIPVTVGGVEGIKTIPFERGGLAIEGIYVNKGNKMYSMAYSFKTDIPEQKTKIEDIIGSIKFTGTESDYSEPFTDGTQEAMNQTSDLKVKKDLEILEYSLIQYHNQYKLYPTTLPMLQEVGYIKEIPLNPYTNRSYEYSSNGQTFTLTGIKSDGTPITISR